MLSFFTAILTSVLWLAGIGFWISAKLADVAISSLALNEIAVYGLIILLPIFMVWFLWALFYGFCQQLSLQKQIAKLSVQINKNQEYTDIIAQNIIKGAQQHAHAFALGKIEMYIKETNEILADILQRYHLLNEKNMMKIWETVNLGNHWGFARAFVDLRNSIPDFEDKITAAARKEKLLSGSLMEFCARYTKLLHLLKEHDEENIIQEVVETGVYGRVFTIFAPIVQKLQENPQEEPVNAEEEKIVPEPIVLKEEECFFKDAIVEKVDEKTEISQPVAEEKEENKMPEIKIEKPEEMPEFISTAKELKADKKEASPKKEKKNNKKSFWNKFLKENEKEEEEDDSQIDPLSLALRRSFGADEKPKAPAVVIEEVPVKEEEPMVTAPVVTEENIEEKQPENEAKDITRFAFASTDETLKNLQKEWAEMQKPELTAANNEAEKQNDE